MPANAVRPYFYFRRTRPNDIETLFMLRASGIRGGVCGYGVGLATEKSQVRVPAAPLHVTTLGKLFTHMCRCSSNSINCTGISWELKRHSTRHTSPVTADLYSFGWCLAEGYRNGDQRRLMDPCGS